MPRDDRGSDPHGGGRQDGVRPLLPWGATNSSSPLRVAPLVNKSAATTQTNVYGWTLAPRSAKLQRV